MNVTYNNFSILTLFISIGIYCFFKFKNTSTLRDLKGRTIVITGANTGIGYAAAKLLAIQGATVIIGCRDESKGKMAAKRISLETNNPKVFFKQLDLVDLRSIERFSSEIDDCHVLINNAGALFKQESYINGVEKTLMTNYLGHFYLTNLLLPKIKNSSLRGYDKKDKSLSNPVECRIINVSSRLEKINTFGPKYVEGNKDAIEEIFSHPQPFEYEYWKAYGNSKFAQVLNTKHLDLLLKKDFNPNDKKGSPIIRVNSMTPGFTNSDISRFAKSWVLWISYPLRVAFLRTVDQAAESISFVAGASEINGISGIYFDDNKTPMITSKHSGNKELANLLWERSQVAIENINNQLNQH